MKGDKEASGYSLLMFAISKDLRTTPKYISNNTLDYE